MNLLLDTHIWIWFLNADARLPRKMRDALQSPQNSLWLSPITPWETHILAERGRLVLQPDPKTWIQDALTSGDWQEAPINHEVMLASRTFKFHHVDPADRILAATAVVYDLKFVTLDRELKGLKWLPVWNG